MERGDNAEVKTEKINNHVNNCKKSKAEKSQNIYINENCNRTNTSTVKKKFKCKLCDRKYAYSCTLKNHMRVHTGEKPFKCSKCKQAFTRRDLLTTHIKVHEEGGTCEICNRNFTSIKNLTKHLEQRHGLKNVETTLSNCNICQKKFQSRNSLTADICLTCKLQGKFTCKICKRNFRYETGDTGYISHMKSHALAKLSKPLVCNLCHYEFNNSNSYVTHMRTHTGEKPFSCDTCHKKFGYKSTLVQHICVDGERPYMRKVITVEEQKYVCNVCHTQFKSGHALTCHMRKHKDDKPFSCDKIYVREGRVSEIEMKRENIERDEMESGDIGIAEIKIFAIQSAIKEEESEIKEEK